MAVVTGQSRTLAPRASRHLKASLRIVALRLSPIAMALVVEPWAAAAFALEMLSGKSRTETAVENSGGDGSAVHRQRHIVNAAVILLGLCVAIIGTLQLTNQSDRTWSDEIAWIASGLMLGSIALSFTALRTGMQQLRLMRLADAAFLAGMASVVVSMVAAACQL